MAHPDRHAFTVERTNGDHFVWRCRCTHVIVQDPRDKPADIQAALIAHATGQTR